MTNSRDERLDPSDINGMIEDISSAFGCVIEEAREAREAKRNRIERALRELRARRMGDASMICHLCGKGPGPTLSIPNQVAIELGITLGEYDEQPLQMPPNFRGFLYCQGNVFHGFCHYSAHRPEYGGYPGDGQYPEPPALDSFVARMRWTRE